jgi:iron(III) transport system substrate-binding protein
MNTARDAEGTGFAAPAVGADGTGRRQFLGATIATAAGTTLGFPAIVRAQEEKRVVLYCPESPDLSSKLAKAFEADTGITVNVQYGGTNVIVNRLLAERRNPNADVWYGGGGLLSFLYAKREGITTPYVPPEFKDMPVQQGPVYLRDPEWHFVGAEVFVIGFAFNPKMISRADAPKTWDDLLDPKWKGQIQMPNPAASGTATLTVLGRMMEELRKGRTEKEAWGYFEQLHKSVALYPESGAAPTRAVAKGDARVGICFSFMPWSLAARGESVDFILPAQTPVIANPVALVKGAKRPENGKRLYDFILGEKGQKILADHSQIVLNRKVKATTPLSFDDVAKNAMPLDLEWAQANYDRVRNDWRAKFG